MRDLQALTRAVYANPEELTAKLVLADALDESGTEGNAARAELIRLQYALAKHPKMMCIKYTPPMLASRRSRASCQDCEPCLLRDRESLLIQNNPKWTTLVCPRCVGLGVTEPTREEGDLRLSAIHCRYCLGAGDLLSEACAHGSAQRYKQLTQERRLIDWSGGFIWGLHILAANLGINRPSVVGPDVYWSAHPSVHAKTLVTFIPTMRELVIVDHQPCLDWESCRHPDVTRGSAYWSRERWEGDQEYDFRFVPSSEIPAELFDRLPRDECRSVVLPNWKQVPGTVRVYPSEELAIAALARVTYQWVKDTPLE